MDNNRQETYTLEIQGATSVTITVRAPFAKLEPLLPKAAAHISAETEIEGFRKGKAPYEVVTQRVGEFKLLEEAARLYIQQTFAHILAEVARNEYSAKSFEPVGEPEVTITKLAPREELEFAITLSLLPAIELPDYRTVAKGVLATKRMAEPTEGEVADALERLRESRAKLVTVRRPAIVGDRLEVDFSTSIGGVPLEGGSSKNHPFILGRSRFLPGFDDKLVGMKAGEEKTFLLEVPPDWRDTRVAGRTLECKAAVNLVQERDVPAWNDAFAASLGNFSSAAEVVKNIRDGLEVEKQEKERERVRIAMAGAIASQTRTDVPPPLVERELEKMIAELESSVAGAGLALADYLAHIKKGTEDLRRAWRPDAEQRVKIALVLREIARKEGIQPNEEEVRQATERTLAHRGLTNGEVQAIDRKRFLEYHAGIARNERVFQFLESLS